MNLFCSIRFFRNFDFRNPIFSKIGFLKPRFELKNPIFEKNGLRRLYLTREQIELF
jgi:hypothetical protein